MGTRRIDPQRAKELMESGDYRFLDVRMPEEFDQGHVPGAQNVPLLIKGPGGAGIFPNENFTSSIEKNFEKTDRIIVGCQKGGRSLQATGLLSELGYTHVFDMRGGFVGETDPFGNVTFPGWTSKGFPISEESTAEQRYTV